MMAGAATKRSPRNRTLSDFRPQSINANKHTQRGLGMLDQALSEDGYVAPMTAAADGEIIDGSARLERVAERFRDVEPIVIEHDGTRPIIAVRSDIPSADTPEAKRIALRANRIAQADLEWDTEVLAHLVAEMPGVTAGLWEDWELAMLLERPDFVPVGIEEQGRLDEKAKTQCPECGHVFEPKPLKV